MLTLIKVLNNTISGGATINDTLLHAGVPNAPFGGVGESGMSTSLYRPKVNTNSILGYGFYHGEYGFKAFTHLRTVVGLPSWFDTVLSFRYPPFKKKTIAQLAVKNKMGFKRGETMADQKVGVKKNRVFSLIFRAGMILVLLGAIDGYTGRLGLLSAVMAKFQKLKASLSSK